MPMFETLKFNFSEANWIVTTILGIYIWFINKQSASAKEMLDLRMRVVELENTVKDMPSKVDVENLRGELNSLNKQMDIVQHGVRRIVQWLIDNKK